jgi:hypothetical protein
VTEILSRTIKIDRQIDIQVKNFNVGLEIYKTCFTGNVTVNDNDRRNSVAVTVHWVLEMANNRGK